MPGLAGRSSAKRPCSRSRSASSTRRTVRLGAMIPLYGAMFSHSAAALMLSHVLRMIAACARRQDRSDRPNRIYHRTFRAAFMTSRTSRHGSTLVSSVAESNAPVSMARLMECTRCGEQRWRKFTRRPETLRGAFAPRAHEARKHRSLPRHRGRRTTGSAPIPADAEAIARPLRSSWSAGRIPGHPLILRASCVTSAP